MKVPFHNARKCPAAFQISPHLSHHLHQRVGTLALRGEEVDRGPMFTLVPHHGSTPHWLPPSMAVHHGDWKLIRTFHYGENGNHEYRLYNLRDDIGENNNLAADLPEKVKALDGLIEEYIAEAEVVVPLPNPNFDPAKFDPTMIGVQPGGLKMHPTDPKSKATPTPKPQATSKSKPKTKSVAKKATDRMGNVGLRERVRYNLAYSGSFPKVLKKSAKKKLEHHNAND